jgi:hypothetical protein
VTQVVLPILGLFGIWVFVAAVAAGCGSLVRGRGSVAMGDVWIGLAILAAYLLPGDSGSREPYAAGLGRASIAAAPSCWGRSPSAPR